MHHNDHLEARLWLGRHGRRRGIGALARGFMGGGPDGEGLRLSRKMAAQDLQLLLLRLLEERPSHGYELIKALEERSNGYYAPSPGMVYPALTYLEELGYATVAPEGAKKLYSLTEEGRRHLGENREHTDAMLSQLERIGRKMERVRRAFAEGEDDGIGLQEVRLASRELRRALHDRRGCSAEEARRIAEVLRRAAAEIRRRD